MALLTDEEVKQNGINYLGINQDTGKFETTDKRLFPAVKGRLLGFNTHDFKYRDENIKKFDIFLKDDGIYQIQIGFFSWQTFKLLNSLMNITDMLNGGVLYVEAGKRNDNYNIRIEWNGEPIKWKKSFEELKLKDKTGKDKEAHRNKIIAKWFTDLMTVKPYTPSVTNNQNEGDDGFTYSDEKAKDDDDTDF